MIVCVCVCDPCVGVGVRQCIYVSTFFNKLDMGKFPMVPKKNHGSQLPANSKPHLGLSARHSIGYWFKFSPSQDNILNRV